LTIAVYPGTFDPVHLGHLDIAMRAAQLFEKLIVAVYDRPQKQLLFSAAERVAMVREGLVDCDNIEVMAYSGLTVDFVHQHQAAVIVRGLRVISDFELEYQMALTNRKLAPDVDMVCLMTALEFAFLSSSIIREIMMAGGCVRQFVPPHVEVALRLKLSRDKQRGGGAG
jgi:pantetheine-phosphate adenylyltransferase